MADAGKVAILPRGLWSAETVYEPLDLVYYNNNSFVALKESVGVTPVDGDTWMLSLSGISQETIDAILNGTQPVGDSNKLGGKDASEYITTNGGTFDKGKHISFQPKDTSGNEVGEYFKNADGTYFGGVGVKAQDGVCKYLFMSAYGENTSSIDKCFSVYPDAIKWKNQEVLHTGNKPSGSYTGNGDATERVIETGGIGWVCYVERQGISLFVTARGAFGWKNLDNSSMEIFTSSEIYLDANCRIHTFSDSEYFNASGYNYYYKVL